MVLLLLTIQILRIAPTHSEDSVSSIMDTYTMHHLLASQETAGLIHSPRCTMVDQLMAATALNSIQMDSHNMWINWRQRHMSVDGRVGQGRLTKRGEAVDKWRGGGVEGCTSGNTRMTGRLKARSMSCSLIKLTQSLLSSMTTEGKRLKKEKSAKVMKLNEITSSIKFVWLSLSQ